MADLSTRRRLASNRYVHSKVRNFDTNYIDVNIDALSGKINKSLDNLIDTAIRQSLQQEKEVYRMMGVSDHYDLERYLNFPLLKGEIFSMIDLEEVVKEGLNTYELRKVDTMDFNTMTEKIEKEIDRFAEKCAIQISDTLHSLGDSSPFIMPNIEATADLTRKMRENGNIQLNDYNFGIATRDNIIESVRGFVGHEQENYIDFVVKSLQAVFDGEGIMDFNSIHEATLFATRGQYSAPTGIAELDYQSKQYSKKIDEVITDIQLLGGGSSADVTNMLVYGMVNILFFSTSGGMTTRGNVYNYPLEGFGIYDDYVTLINSVAKFWAGKDFLNEIQLRRNSPLLILGPNVVPISELLKGLKTSLKEQRNSKVNFMAPSFDPMALWRRKQNDMKQMPAVVGGNFTYSEPLMSTGSSIGHTIAQQTIINTKVDIAIKNFLGRW